MASSSASRADITGGVCPSGVERDAPSSADASRESSMAWRASPSRCEPSLLAEPSTPRPTFTPAARYCRTGAMPEASRMLDEGQWATPVPVRASSGISAAFTHTACACHTSSPTQPSCSA